MTTDNSRYRQPQAPPVPSLVLPMHVWQNMMAYVTQCPTEINGFGYVDRIAGGLLVSEVFIIDQIATAASVEVDQLALNRHMTDMLNAGDEPGRLRFQWHSHVNFAAYFSTTDTNNIEGYAGGDWMVSLVVNKRGEYEARLDVYRPFRYWTSLTPQIVMPTDHALAAVCRQEILAKVRQPGGFGTKKIRDKHLNGDTATAVEPDMVLLLEGGTDDQAG